MSIITVDVGLKNLAICLMNYESIKNDNKSISDCKIHLWKVYNTLETEQENYERNKICDLTTLSGKPCKKHALYKILHEDKTIYTCKKHLEKSNTDKEVKKTNTGKRVKDFLLQDITSIILKKMDDIIQEDLKYYLENTNISYV
jgi:uncharacterized protein (UPF0297 family)